MSTLGLKSFASWLKMLGSLDESFPVKPIRLTREKNARGQSVFPVTTEHNLNWYQLCMKCGFAFVGNGVTPENFPLEQLGTGKETSFFVLLKGQKNATLTDIIVELAEWETQTPANIEDLMVFWLTYQKTINPGAAIVALGSSVCLDVYHMLDSHPMIATNKDGEAWLEFCDCHYNAPPSQERKRDYLFLMRMT